MLSRWKYEKYYIDRMNVNDISYFVTPRQVGMSSIVKGYIFDWCYKNPNSTCLFIDNERNTGHRFFNIYSYRDLGKEYGDLNSIIDRTTQHYILFYNKSKIYFENTVKIQDFVSYDVIIVDNIPRFEYTEHRLNSFMNNISKVFYGGFKKIIIIGGIPNKKQELFNRLDNMLMGSDYKIHFNNKTVEELKNIEKLYRKEKILSIFA